MRKLLFSLPSLCLLIIACKDFVPGSIIKMKGLYINDGEMGYARQMEASPPPEVDDELEISLKLGGNGRELSMLPMKGETLGNEVNTAMIDFSGLPERVLSDDEEFTDKDNGKLGFKDGVSQTKVGLRAKVWQIIEGGVKLKSYPFSKSVNYERTKYKLKVRTFENQTDQLGDLTYRKSNAFNSIVLSICRQSYGFLQFHPNCF